MDSLPPSGPLRFGTFELDPFAGELRRNGSLVRLPPQPFRVLQLLVQSAGKVVDRNRIRSEVWGETAVDFDRSLNVCIAQIRTALNDDAESPRFIQTLPRRGYRFLAPVDKAGEPPPSIAPPVVVRRWTGPVLIAGTLLVAIAAAGYRMATPRETAVRIAVLPFEAVGLPPGDSAQVEGIFDELLTRLGGVQPDRLSVIGRRSVARFRREPKPLREIGEQLNAGYAIEATVRMAGTRLRVAMRLAQTGSEAVLWSETFAQEGEPAEFEERLVARVSAAVLTRLFPNAAPPVQEAGCREGWEAYRTGKLLADRGTIAGLEKSLAYFEQASCVESRATLAETLIRLARIDSRYDAGWERARTSASDALRADTNARGAHRSMGNVAFWHDWDWKTAEREFQEALRRNPSDPDAHHDIAWLLVALGRRPEAVASLQRAIALDPLSVRVHMDAGWLLLQAGRFQEAAAQARRTLELEPESKEARACLSRALLYAGDDHGALEAIRPLVSEDELRAVAGLPAAQAVRSLFRGGIRGPGMMDPYQRAWRLAWIGSRDEALAQLEEAFRKRSRMMPMVAVDPAFAAVRSDARFQQVVRGMGL